MELKESSIPCLQAFAGIVKTCRDEGLKLVLDTTNNHGLKRRSRRHLQNRKRKKANEFEVDDIVDHCIVENGTDMYFVKWKGWPSKFNSWEPRTNLDGCKKLIEKFHYTRLKSKTHSVALPSKQRKIDAFFKEITKPSAECISAFLKQSNQKRPRTIKMFASSALVRTPNSAKRHLIIDTIDAQLILQREDVLEKLKEWENVINLVSIDSAPIVVENDYDLEGPPENFTYINTYQPANGIVIPDDPLVGCECKDCFDNRKGCCATQSGGKFAYNKQRKLRIPVGSPIYECNRRCKCPPECPNRVVQHGRQVKLAIFRTANGCGWGVKAVDSIKKDMFVTEYVGEVITSEEAEKRGKIYDAQGRTYLFDLDYNDGDCPFTVDAAYYGNVSHFINHSCDPNLVVYGVWINNLDPALPHIAFFSKRDIKAGEELTFDYRMNANTTADDRNTTSAENVSSQKRIPCKCGTTSCRKYLI